MDRRVGDWECPACHVNNFRGRMACFRCGKSRPPHTIPKSEAAKPGDWTCTGCSRVNFSRRYVCFHCKKAKPHTEGEEWEDHVEAVTAAAAAEAVVEEHRPAPVSPVAQVLASPQSPGTPGSSPLPGQRRGAILIAAPPAGPVGTEPAPSPSNSGSALAKTAAPR